VATSSCSYVCGKKLGTVWVALGLIMGLENIRFRKSMSFEAPPE